MPDMPNDLSAHEKALVEAAQAGLVWTAPTVPDGQTDKPAIRASTIRSLYLGLWDDVVADPKGVRVVGARILGELDLSLGTGRGALSLQKCQFDDQLVVQDARLSSLWLRGSRLAKGLHGDGVRIEGDLFCDEGFSASGEVRLLGAQVGGDVVFRGAMLDGNGWGALNADRMEVRGSVFCDGGFSAAGGVRLQGAQVGGNVAFRGATLDGNGGYALSADRMVVKGSVFCRSSEDGQGFSIAGDAILVGGRIDGLVDWRPENWTGTLKLSHTTVGQWYDDFGGEGNEAADAQGSFILDHFTYEAFFSGNGMKGDSATRIAWIEASQKHDGFKPSPYRVLARVLRAAGDDRGAADVGLALARARVKHRAKAYSGPRRWLYRLWMELLDHSIGHGYQPWQWGIGLLGWLVAGWIFFCLGAPTSYGGPGHIKPADPVFVTENKMQNRGQPAPTSHDIKYDDLPPEYTPFSAFWYSFDTLVPLVDLGQERAWSPSPLTSNVLDDLSGWLLLFYLYLHIIAGWVLTTLTVVALTGLIKRDPEGEG